MKRLLIIAAVAGLVVLAARKGAQRRDEWHGLSEAEVRDRLRQRLPDRMPEERREAVTEKIVTKMRERGVLAEDDAPAADAGDDTSVVDLTDTQPTPTEGAADTVGQTTSA